MVHTHFYKIKYVSDFYFYTCHYTCIYTHLNVKGHTTPPLFLSLRNTSRQIHGCDIEFSHRNHVSSPIRCLVPEDIAYKVAWCSHWGYWTWHDCSSEGFATLCVSTYADSLHEMKRGKPWPWFSINMTFYQYRKSHCVDKTILRPSYLHNGLSYTGKMKCLYWIRVQLTILIRKWQLKVMTKRIIQLPNVIWHYLYLPCTEWYGVYMSVPHWIHTQFCI